MSDAYETLTQVLQERHSCRAFRPDPVPDEVITRIVTAAGQVPSWCNAQPWQITVTRGAETERFRTALLERAAQGNPNPDQPWPQGFPGIYGDRRRTCGFQLYDAVGIARDDRPARAEQSMRNYRLFDAPHVAIVHSEAALGPYGAMDTGGFITAFMLAARSLGVDTIAQAAIAAYSPMVREHFGLQDTRTVLCAISFGYGDTDHPVNGFRTERADLDEILDMRG
ncbi:nitroreductase [Roseovarius pacificus]|uniref:nitroreductase n=1 Tax=Roseovarius pacificus TaxID=337701 RepID=UPI002A189B9B|nr:nitroreductase [Roseovarius pacificus]